MAREVPPEVPDEFAEAYLAAYEAALAETPSPGVHRRVASEGPSRRSFLAPQDPGPASQDPGPASHEDGPASHHDGVVAERGKPDLNMAAVMLVVLALVLFLGAYLLGLLFASRVRG